MRFIMTALLLLFNFLNQIHTASFNFGSQLHYCRFHFADGNTVIF